MVHVKILFTALLATSVAADGWLPGTRAVYNKWHETELERWLSDNGIPYPKAATRKDLQDLVDTNWNDYVVQPYNKWTPDQLTEFLKSQGQTIKENSETTLEYLVNQAKINWYDTSDYVGKQSGNMREWVWDTWSDNQLVAFAEKHGIDVPGVKKRDTLIHKAQAAYDAAAKQAGQTAGYAGDWLYESWTDADLKAWLDARGIPVPQITKRNELVAQVRRNAYIAHLKTRHELARVSAKSRKAFAELKDSTIDAWDLSKLQEFCDANGIQVPHGSKVGDIRALIRQRSAQVMGTDAKGHASKAYKDGASAVSEKFEEATNAASEAAREAFSAATNTWSESRLKSYLDAHGVPVPHASKPDELRALVRKHGHKAASGWSAWTFDDLGRDELKAYLSKHGDKAAKALAEKKDVSMKELSQAAHSAYSSASTHGGESYASATSYLSSKATEASSSAFSTWSESDLKAYLDSYGVKVPQGSTVDEIRALARRQATYFRYGTSSPSETLLAKLAEGWGWITEQLSNGFDAAKQHGKEAEEAAREKLNDEL